MSVIVEFRARIREIDGIAYASVPELKESHVIQGERLQYTERSIRNAAELLRLGQGMRRMDSPRLQHVSGDYMGTFRIDLGTHRTLKLARAARAEAMGSGWDSSTERLGEYEDRLYRAALTVFEEGASA